MTVGRGAATGVLAVLAAGLVLAGLGVPARALCLEVTPERALARAASVFTGVAEDVGEFGALARVRVDRVWKGPDLAERVAVRGGSAPGLLHLFVQAGESTDTEFTPGAGYLFVVDDLSSFEVAECGGTTTLSDAVARAEPAGSRSPTAGGLTGAPTGALPRWAALPALAVGAVAGGLYLLRRRARGRGRPGSRPGSRPGPAR